MSGEDIPEKKQHKYELSPKEQQGKLEPTKPIDIILYGAIGIIVSLINIWINAIDWEELGRTVLEGQILLLWSYFYIIFLLVIPSLIFGNFKRSRGTVYILGYIIGGSIVFFGGLIFSDNKYIFIGGYTAIVAFSLFSIIALIFKAWQSFDKMKFG
jgi:hypothetical protein